LGQDRSIQGVHVSIKANSYQFPREYVSMADDISLDGRTLVGVENADQGEVSGDTEFRFEQDGNRIYAQYSGGEIIDGHLVGTLKGNQWDIRYAQINENDETATGHSIGEITVLNDGRVRIEDQWEWESQEGTGESILEEVE